MADHLLGYTIRYSLSLSCPWQTTSWDTPSGTVSLCPALGRPPRGIHHQVQSLFVLPLADHLLGYTIRYSLSLSCPWPTTSWDTPSGTVSLCPALGRPPPGIHHQVQSLFVLPLADHLLGYTIRYSLSLSCPWLTTSWDTPSGTVSLCPALGRPPPGIHHQVQSLFVLSLADHLLGYTIRYSLSLSCPWLTTSWDTPSGTVSLCPALGRPPRGIHHQVQSLFVLPLADHLLGYTIRYSLSLSCPWPTTSWDTPSGTVSLCPALGRPPPGIHHQVQSLFVLPLADHLLGYTIRYSLSLSCPWLTTSWDTPSGTVSLCPALGRPPPGIHHQVQSLFVLSLADHLLGYTIRYSLSLSCPWPTTSWDTPSGTVSLCPVLGRPPPGIHHQVQSLFVLPLADHLLGYTIRYSLSLSCPWLTTSWDTPSGTVSLCPALGRPPPGIHHQVQSLFVLSLADHLLGYTIRYSLSLSFPWLTTSWDTPSGTVSLCPALG